VADVRWKKEDHMARRNIEGAGNEMSKASRGRVCMGTPIRVLSSVMHELLQRGPGRSPE